MEGHFRFSLAGQRAKTWSASRTHLSQVPDVGQRTIWTLWHHLEQCVRSFKF